MNSRLFVLPLLAFAVACSSSSPSESGSDQGAVALADPCAEKLNLVKHTAAQVARDKVALDAYAAEVARAEREGRQVPEGPTTLRVCDAVDGAEDESYTPGGVGRLALAATGGACPANRTAIASDPALAEVRKVLEGTIAGAIAKGETDGNGRNLKAVLDKGVTLYGPGMGVFGSTERRVFKDGKVTTEKLDVDVDTGRVGDWKPGTSETYRVEGASVIIGAERYDLQVEREVWLEKRGGQVGEMLFDHPSECDA